MFFLFFFKQKTAYEMRISDWSSDRVLFRSQEIIDRLKWDGEFFIEFHLADELTSPVPRLHVEVWGLLTSTAMQRVLLAIPRDHAKTTLSKLAVVWYFRYTNHRFCVYLSNTNTIAKNACKDIIGYLKSPNRSEEHTSELQSLMRSSYAVFCLKKKTPQSATKKNHTNIKYKYLNINKL